MEYSNVIKRLMEYSNSISNFIRIRLEFSYNVEFRDYNGVQRLKWSTDVIME